MRATATSAGSGSISERPMSGPEPRHPRINADFRGRKLTHTGCESRVLESDREIVQPWNRWAFFIQGGFAQDRIVRPLVEAYDEAVSVHFEQATGFHKLAIELFGLRFVEPMQLSGQPPIAAVGQDSQGDIHVHMEAHLTGQAIEVKEIDTNAEAVLDAV